MNPPLGPSLRRLLRIWALIKLHLSSRSASTRQNKIERATYQDDHKDIIICASQVPPQLSTTISQDTSTTPSLSSPIPIHVTSHLSPYNVSSRNLSGSSLNDLNDNADREDHTFNGLRTYGHMPHYPRSPSMASSRAPSSYRNSHMGAEESAMRGLSPRPILIPSRSASPASRRSPFYYNSNMGAEESAFQHLQHTHHLNISRCPSTASTRPRSPVHGQISNFKAHSMVELHPRNYPSPKSRSQSRNRSPAKPASRARSRSRKPIAFSGNYHERSCTPKADPSPGHIAANPCSSPECVPDHPEIRPCTAVARYDRNVRIKETVADIKHVIPSLTTTYSHENLPQGWIPLAHPEGALYWIHAERIIYTDAYLCEPEVLDEINRFLEVIDGLIDESIGIPPESELVLELSDDEETQKRIWSYYFIDHTDRTLFWLHPFEAESILSGLYGVVSKAHIHHEIQSFYWTHWEQFPHNREVPHIVLQELTGMLVHAGIDSLTSTVSTSIYSEEDLQKFLGYIKILEFVGGNYGHAACVTGRLMSFFAHSRFINFYGQNCARLSRDQTVYEEAVNKPRSALMLLSALLFFAPEVHLQGLESIYTDWVLCQHMWTQFIEKLQKEWEEFTLYATVLLTANVSFLAIPSVDNGPNVRSPSQIASYLSVLTSVGSIITGLLLIRQHRNRNGSAQEVDMFLKSNTSSTRGLETLAVMYSLPYSLLMWAMISFLTAFTLEAVVRPTTLSARLPVVFCWAVVGLLIVWCGIMGWEWENPIRLMRLMFSWTKRLRCRRERESIEEDEVVSKVQNPWFYRVIPRRLSTRASTLVEPSVEMMGQLERSDV